MSRLFYKTSVFVAAVVAAVAFSMVVLAQQPAQQIRGSKTFWRIASAVNTLGSLGYWLIGRRYRRSQPR